MKTYTVINDYDGNDSFEVEADSVESAALAALEALGWNLCEPQEEQE